MSRRGSMRSFDLLAPIALAWSIAGPAQAQIPISTVAGGPTDVRGIDFQQQQGFLSLVWTQVGGSDDGRIKSSLFGAAFVNDVLPVDGSHLVNRPGVQSEPNLAHTGVIGCPANAICPAAVVCYTDAAGPGAMSIRVHRFGDAAPSWDVGATAA